jgi:hypothetical protein
MNARNQTLLKQFGAHPLKANLEKALDAIERFGAASLRIKGNRDLSDQGREKEVQAQARSALRDLRDLREPLDAMRAKRAQLADGVTKLTFDRTDIVGAMNRAELRSVAASLSMLQRMKLLRDPQYRDAILEQPPLVSGLTADGELALYDEARKEQLNDAHGPRLREIEALDSEIEAAAAVFTLARDDLKRELGFGGDDRAFDNFAKPVETRLAAPWLKREKDIAGVERVMRIVSAEADFDGKGAGARLATPDEIRDGKFYANLEEYRADRAA